MSNGPALEAVNHEHLPALLVAGLAVVVVSAGAALLERARLRHPGVAELVGRARGADPRDRAAAALLLLDGVVHMALVPTHLDQPVTAALFLGAGISFMLLSGAVFSTLRWRLPAVFLATATLLGYFLYLAAGWTADRDLVGLATKVIEVVAIAVMIAGRHPRPAPRRRVLVVTRGVRGQELKAVLCELLSQPGSATFEEMTLGDADRLGPALRPRLRRKPSLDGVVAAVPTAEVGTPESLSLSRSLLDAFGIPIIWAPIGGEDRPVPDAAGTRA